ncbi:MAG: hypothetical protein A4E19_05395 [Nitrospira sp. SG-bin1]|nr:MAG: hypothetical protein A4E19_05395 [Nitrospira sp. SG-bin1]
MKAVPGKARQSLPSFLSLNKPALLLVSTRKTSLELIFRWLFPPLLHAFPSFTVHRTKTSVKFLCV